MTSLTISEVHSLMSQAIHNLKVDNVSLTPDMAQHLASSQALNAGLEAGQGVVLKGVNDILNSFAAYYQVSTNLVDTSTQNTINGSQNPDVVKKMHTLNWINGKPPTLNSQESDAVKSDIGPGGMWGPSIQAAKQQTQYQPAIAGIGISSNMQVLAGISGGIGAAFPIFGGSPQGYFYVLGNMGMAIQANANLQFTAFTNPAFSSNTVYGVAVPLMAVVGVVLMYFCTSDGNYNPLGYSVATGLGVGAGATMFVGGIWSFG